MLDWLIARVVTPLAYRLSARRKARGLMRALWGVTPILTLPLKARASAMLGLESRSLVFETYYITQDFDLNLRRFANGAALLGPWAADLADRLILIWALLRFDVFHYFFDRGLMRPRGRFGIRTEELDVLRAAGKVVYVFAYGADIRQREATMALGRWNFCVECPEPGKFCICDDRAAAEIAAVCARITAPVAMADMVGYVPGARIISYWPVDMQAIGPAPASAKEGPLRVVHAPNHAHFKGSPHLEAVIGKLRAAGHAIDYVKVQGVPNHEVMRLFGEADVVADQFLGGAFGYAALEAMARGKPVISYVRSWDMVEAPEECPILNATPDVLEDALLWCLAHRDRLPLIGAQGRAYVSRWHSLEAVAARLGRMYRETIDLPVAVKARIEAHLLAEPARREGVALVSGWETPFRIGVSESRLKRLGQEAQRPPLTAADALRELSAPALRRWWLAAGVLQPHDGWTSYDRSPWRHPWLTTPNISTFSAFNRETFGRLRDASTGAGREGSYAFVGNLANISYMRASGLRRHGMDVDVFLNPQDSSLMSQPFWEDFNGDSTALGDAPATVAVNAALPPHVHRLPLDPDWSRSVEDGTASFLAPSDILTAPDFMCYRPLLEAMQVYDSAIISQTFAFGPLARRPYILAQSGGDMWFDPCRADAMGRLTMRSLREAYAIVASNPITFAHMRRYGLSNCLYLPFCIDEERYRPGDAPDIRRDWQERTGGDFFVLTSMRLDNRWKGAQAALEGFARFSADAPGARLVLLGWGVDQSKALAQLEALGIADKALLLPIVGKVRLARYLRAADVLIEQFVLGYFGASALEAMASGLPVIMRLERAQYDAMVPAGAPPVLDAANAEEVAHQLGRLSRDAVFRQKTGEGLRSWFMASHASGAALDDYRTLMSAAAVGLPIDWTTSPLSSPLTPAEVDYHRTQLSQAPPFPVYEI